MRAGLTARHRLYLHSAAYQADEDRVRKTAAEPGRTAAVFMEKILMRGYAKKQKCMHFPDEEEVFSLGNHFPVGYRFTGSKII